jgi:hypothetical protein
MLTSLPIEIVLIIAQSSSNVWYTLVQVDPRLSVYGINMRNQLQDKFMVTVHTPTCTMYVLPNGTLHRNGGLPAIVAQKNDVPFDLCCNLTISGAGVDKWYQYGKLHRDNDKPAIMYSNGSCEWWVNGKRHRFSKPMIKTKEHYAYWVNGVKLQDN